MAVMFFFEIFGAFLDTIRAFVLQGFPTTRTFTVFLAKLLRASP